MKGAPNAVRVAASAGPGRRRAAVGGLGGTSPASRFPAWPEAA